MCVYYVCACVWRERERERERERGGGGKFHAFKRISYIKQNGQLDAVMLYIPTSPPLLKERAPTPSER